jgi:hypothetical protein
LYIWGRMTLFGHRHVSSLQTTAEKKSIQLNSISCIKQPCP